MSQFSIPQRVRLRPRSGAGAAAGVASCSRHGFTGWHGSARRHTLLIRLNPANPCQSPGTSPHLVARYLTGVGNVDDVLFADQVWAKAGMNPSVYISGDVIVYGKMSKLGNPFFRDTLYLLGYQLALHCAYFGDTFLNAIERGKSEVEATIHTAHKVNRVFIHLLQHDEPFAPPDVPDYPAFRRQWEVRMHRFLAEKKQRRQPKSRRRRPRQRR